MNKSELVREVALRSQLSSNEAINAVDAAMETIAETMHKGGSVTLIGFGNFVVQERGAYEGYNPATGGLMLIPIKRQVKFRPGGGIKLK